MNLSELIEDAYNTTVNHGFIDPKRVDIPCQLALIHSEVSEALEVYRAAGTFNAYAFSEELADVIIRSFSLLGTQGGHQRSAQIIINKMTYNKTRPYMHGGKKF